MSRLAILVTGGGGFIGSNLVTRLISEGHCVSVCDWFGSDEKWRNLTSLLPDDVFLPDHLSDRLKTNCFDVIVHLGAIADTSVDDVDHIIRTNVELSRGLILHCTATCTRLIYASSAATYGDGSAGFDDEDSSTALARLRPLNAYGWSKAIVDNMVAGLRERGEALPPQCVGLKFFNVYGPNERHKGEMRSVVTKIIDQALAGLPITLFKSLHKECVDGGQKRDFIYIRDVVNVISWLIYRPDVSGLFNVGTGEARSFSDVASLILSTIGRDAQIHFVDMPVHFRKRYQNFTEARIERLRSAGYTMPFTSLEEGICDYVAEHILSEVAQQSSRKK